MSFFTSIETTWIYFDEFGPGYRYEYVFEAILMLFEYEFLLRIGMKYFDWRLNVAYSRMKNMTRSVLKANFLGFIAHKDYQA